jgi:hypothetical protein
VRDNESHSDHSGPQWLHADKVYDLPDLGEWLHNQHIDVRIARKGIESSERLGLGNGSSSARSPG